MFLPFGPVNYMGMEISAQFDNVILTAVDIGFLKKYIRYIQIRIYAQYYWNR